MKLFTHSAKTRHSNSKLGNKLVESLITKPTLTLQYGNNYRVAIASKHGSYMVDTIDKSLENNDDRALVLLHEDDGRLIVLQFPRIGDLSTYAKKHVATWPLIDYATLEKLAERNAKSVFLIDSLPEVV